VVLLPVHRANLGWAAAGGLVVGNIQISPWREVLEITPQQVIGWMAAGGLFGFIVSLNPGDPMD
jgi:hypothetical protein